VSVLTTDEKELDSEWLALINEAKNLGLSINEIKEFLSNPK
jgi:DNA-binding transcriptional MerR regulator